LPEKSRVARADRQCCLAYGRYHAGPMILFQIWDQDDSVPWGGVLHCLFQPPGHVEKWSGARARDMARRLGQSYFNNEK
jgi:hypothetical protein